MAMGHSTGFLSPIFVALFGVMSAAVVLAVYHCVIITFCRPRHAGGGPPHRPNDVEAASSIDLSSAQLIPPARKYGKEGDGDNNTCAVCLSEFKDGEAVRLLPECKHCFHVACIDLWLQSHYSCPMCRTITAPWLDRRGEGEGIQG
ncbi:E3 ubiquitin-protein ligase RNF38/44 protein [Dioscorea alata]|uniref:E3 ubiquitin-protein ligase RNF38/44 protein n=1 Tax=Dioscorea alata TaxID=55571 RepID=A0ACB7VG28_DIOAL|nr:E3 ubiquitin-protein ligase RNF38/44 protein [Dioscorea alata]